MYFFNDIFYNLALHEFYFLNINYILLYIKLILPIFFQYSNISTRASHHWCIASNIVLVPVERLFPWVFSITVTDRSRHRSPHGLRYIGAHAEIATKFMKKFGIHGIHLGIYAQKWIYLSHYNKWSQIWIAYYKWHCLAKMNIWFSNMEVYFCIKFLSCIMTLFQYFANCIFQTIMFRIHHYFEWWYTHDGSQMALIKVVPIS